MKSKRQQVEGLGQRSYYRFPASKLRCGTLRKTREERLELIFLLMIPLLGFFVIALSLFAMWPRISAWMDKGKKR